jgi:hypothetical protein
VPLRIEHFGPDTGRGHLTADACVHALLVFLHVLPVVLVVGFWEVVGGGDLLRLEAQHLVQVGGENTGDGHVQVDGEGGQTQGDEQCQPRRQLGTEAVKHVAAPAAHSRRPARHDAGRARRPR